MSATYSDIIYVNWGEAGLAASLRYRVRAWVSAALGYVVEPSVGMTEDPDCPGCYYVRLSTPSTAWDSPIAIVDDQSGLPGSYRIAKIQQNANVVRANGRELEPYDIGDALDSILNQFATGRVYLIRAYLNGEIEIRKGDSYSAASGQRITVSKPPGASWPTTLEGLTLTFTARKRGNNSNAGEGTLGPITCVHGTETGSGQSFYIDLTRADTDGLAVGMWDYDVEASNGSTIYNTLVSGPMRVLPEYTA